MKWKLGLAAVLLLCAVMMAVTASADEQSGTCGESLTWTLTDDGVLNISGNGPMFDYDWGNKLPWEDKPINVIIADGVTSIGNYAFDSCVNLTSVTIPDSVTSIGHCAFYRCSSLTSVTIPDSVTSIGDHAFEYCYSLPSVIIPNSVMNIGTNPFASCEKLSDIHVSENHPALAVIDGVLFSKADKWLVCYPCGKSGSSYVIPQGTLAIDGAFDGCSSLESVTIPDSVTRIGEFSFFDCSSLKSVTIPNGVTSIGVNAFNLCSSLTSVTIPESVTSIGAAAFNECSSLTSVTIPNSLKSINDYTFTSCISLTSVTIPDSVINIDECAFYGCSSLTGVTFQVKDPDAQITFGYDIFTNSSPTFYCYRSTAPDKWCQENGITPVYLDDEPVPCQHVPEDVPEVKPTKDQPGRTAGTKCSVCGEILSGCEEIPALGYEPGDLNGNGTIDGRDLLRLARYLAGGNVEINEAAADLNGDGKVDGRDLLRLARYLAGQDVKLGK